MLPKIHHKKHDKRGDPEVLYLELSLRRRRSGCSLRSFVTVVARLGEGNEGFGDIILGITQLRRLFAASSISGVHLWLSSSSVFRNREPGFGEEKQPYWGREGD